MPMQNAALDELKRQTPGDLAGLASPPGLGPKRVEQLHDELDIASLADLRNAAASRRLRTVRGFGPRLVAALRAALARPRAGGAEKAVEAMA